MSTRITVTTMELQAILDLLKTLKDDLAHKLIEVEELLHMLENAVEGDQFTPVLDELRQKTREYGELLQRVDSLISNLYFMTGSYAKAEAKVTVYNALDSLISDDHITQDNNGPEKITPCRPLEGIESTQDTQAIDSAVEDNQSVDPNTNDLCELREFESSQAMSSSVWDNQSANQNTSNLLESDDSGEVFSSLQSQDTDAGFSGWEVSSSSDSHNSSFGLHEYADIQMSGSSSYEPAYKPSSRRTSILPGILLAPFAALGVLFNGVQKSGKEEPSEEIGDGTNESDPCIPDASDHGSFGVDRHNTTMKGAVSWKSAPQENSGQKPEEGVSIQFVQFSAIAPAKMKRGDYSIVQLLMYEDEYREVVERIISRSEDPVSETPGGDLQIRQESRILVRLVSPDIVVDGKMLALEENRVWQGGYQNFSFAVLPPADYDKRQILFRAEIYVNDIIASNLTFVAAVDSDQEQQLEIRRRDILSAFISYASEDRARVASIVQGMQKARPDLDVFMDVDKLRSGEQWEPVLRKEIDSRDIFYLCWSLAAKGSRFVEMEWRYALAHRGLDYIEPVPIDPPHICPPPDELSSKHFNDRLLYLIRASE